MIAETTGSQDSGESKKGFSVFAMIRASSTRIYIGDGIVFKFWTITLFRLASTSLDLLALAIIWFTTSAVVAGQFPEITFLGWQIVKAAELNEGLVLLYGSLAFMLFTLRSSIGAGTLVALRNLGARVETGVAAQILDNNLFNHVRGGAEASETFPLVQHSIQSVRAWANGAVRGMSLLISEGAFVLILFVTMLLANSKTTAIVTLTLLATALAMGIIVNPRIRDAAKTQRNSNLSWSSDLSSVLGSETSIRIRAVGELWKQNMLEDIQRSSRAAGQVFVLNSLPRYVLEFVVLLCISVVVGFSFVDGDFSENAGDSAIILAAAFRMSSAMLPLQTAVSSVTFGQEVGKSIMKGLEGHQRQRGSRVPNKAVVQRLTNFVREDRERLIILSGESGSGKTSTLLEVVSVLSQPESKDSIGYAGQDPSIFSGGLTKNLFLTPSSSAQKLPPTVKRLAEALGMQEILERMASAEASPHVGMTLSGGELTRLEILRAHVDDPRAIFLDEPTTGLDTEKAVRLARFILSSEAKYVIVTHDEKFAAELKCDNRIQM